MPDFKTPWDDDRRLIQMYSLETINDVPPQDAQPTSTKTRRRGGKPRKKELTRQERLLQLPWLTLILTAVMVVVFVVELIKMGIWTGSPIQTKPQFNPMIGPSPYVLINMGARYNYCMRANNQSSVLFPCPNSTTVDTYNCSLEELCGFGMQKNGRLQSWRFITAIFLHTGFIHIIFNMLLQVVLGWKLEKHLGHIRFFFIYFCSGIGGYLLSGNFAGNASASVGASGALFGLIALDMLDLLFNWDLYPKPVFNLMTYIVEIVISFVLGLLPGLDNFAHIGGFAVGVLSGIILLHSPLRFRLKKECEANPRKRFDIVEVNPYRPFKHMAHRSPGWWVWGVVRVVAFALLIVYYALLIHNYETGKSNCSWCKYLSCLPVHGWCDANYVVN